MSRLCLNAFGCEPATPHHIRIRYVSWSASFGYSWVCANHALSITTQATYDAAGSQAQVRTLNTARVDGHEYKHKPPSMQGMGSCTPACLQTVAAGRFHSWPPPSRYPTPWNPGRRAGWRSEDVCGKPWPAGHAVAERFKETRPSVR